MQVGTLFASLCVASIHTFFLCVHFQSVPHRVLAAKLGAYELIVGTLEKETALDKEVLLELVAAANAIINKQPDVFGSKSLEVALRYFIQEITRRTQV